MDAARFTRYHPRALPAYPGPAHRSLPAAVFYPRPATVFADYTERHFTAEQAGKVSSLIPNTP